ncbi:MAG: ImmA/IrrE family metallo-endopeptidase [Candidatus Omnitrophica bacterium]|nr:ImmA/IrrE family metallo-endopeptidase [Candidatus Omnitrophota bacterium]
MPKVKALITPEVIAWAREQSGYTISAVAIKIKKTEEEIKSWEAGDDLPSIAQARELSRLYKRPLAVFYLPVPPKDFQTLRDYRRLQTLEERKLSVELIDLIRDVIEQQGWARDYLGEEEKELDIIGAGRINSNVYDLAEEMRSRLEIDINKQMKSASRYEALKYWLAKIENNGIFIVRRGGIELSECRGFVISDKFAPFIFLNSEDALVAQLFTLAHELVHLWINESGISNLEARGNFISNQASNVERFCNNVASEIIMPDQIFKEILKHINGYKDTRDKIEILSKEFKVSEEVVARRLLDMREISQEIYENLHKFFIERWKELKTIEKKKAKEREGGPSYYTKMVTYNGLSFTQMVIGAYSSGKLAGRDASSLLDVKINNFKKLSEKTNDLFFSRFNLIQNG